MQRLIFTSDPSGALSRVIADIAPEGKIFLLADTNTADCCLPLLQTAIDSYAPEVIVITDGDANKNVSSLSEIWREMSRRGATRRSLMINLGGGMISDIGGFAAATFKRGIRSVNVPTTLLAAVDAAVGGKTGINFDGLKNEIGAFAPAEYVIVSSEFYSTLPADELLSGYGEVLKHALIDSAGALAEALSVDPTSARPSEFAPVLEQSVRIKQSIVDRDPFEQGIRRALNLGHTAAHAFESLAMERGVRLPHGIAVAHGLVVDLVLSRLLKDFPSDLLHGVAAFVKSHYPAPVFDCNDYDSLISFMRHDKKNASPDNINFTLLNSPGDVEIDCIVEPQTITAAFDLTRDLLGV